MNIKKQLALAQLDQLEQQDAQRQNAEAMQLLQLMLGAKQNEDAGRRADAGIDLESQRFAEAQRQFGVTTDESRANRQSDIDWRQSRAKTEDTRLADEQTYKRQRDSVGDIRLAGEQAYSRGQDQVKTADAEEKFRQSKIAAAMQALAQAGGNVEQLKPYLTQLLGEAMPVMPVDKVATPQGGVMTEEALKAAQAAARAEDLKAEAQNRALKEKYGAAAYYLGLNPANKAIKFANWIAPKSMQKPTVSDLLLN